MHGEPMGEEQLRSDVSLGRTGIWEGRRLKVPETAALLVVFAILMIFFSSSRTSS
jgi:hypothetical protein